MDLIKNTLTLSTETSEIKDEINLSESIKLADNMANIGRIIFTDIDPAVTEAAVSNGVLTVKGSAVIDIVYEADSGRPASVSTVVPFEVIKECDCTDAEVFAGVSAESIKTTASKQRRAEVSAVLKLSGRIFSVGEAENLRVDEGDGIFTKQTDISTCLIKKITDRESYDFTFDIEEENASAAFFTCDVCAQTTTFSHAGIMYSAMVRAEAVYTYTDADGDIRYRSVSDVFSVSKLIETDITCEFDSYEINARICDKHAQCLGSEGGAAIEAGCEISFSLILVKQVELSCLADIYGTEKMLTPVFSPASCVQCRRHFTETITVSGRVTLPAGINTPAYTASQLDSTILCEGGFLRITGSVHIDALVLKDDTGAFTAAETDIPFEYVKEDWDIEGSSTMFTAEAGISRCLNAADGLTVDAEITFTVIEAAQQGYSALTEITENEYPQDEDDFITVKVHFYEKNEDLWRLAKENRISVGTLLKANGLESAADLKERQPLLIL